MFRLIKLGMYAALAWVIYEIYQGMTQGTGSFANMGGGGGMGRSEGQSSFGQSGGAGQLTGEGVGQTVETAEPGGVSMQHRVGRGVVLR